MPLRCVSVFHLARPESAPRSDMPVVVDVAFDGGRLILAANGSPCVFRFGYGVPSLAGLCVETVRQPFSPHVMESATHLIAQTHRAIHVHAHPPSYLPLPSFPGSAAGS